MVRSACARSSRLRCVAPPHIAIMSRYESRAALAREFGATAVTAERGDAGVAAAREMFGGVGADAVLECVGTEQAMRQTLGAARPGGRVGYVGVPLGPELSYRYLFRKNLIVGGGGAAPVLKYLPELLPAVLEGRISPGRVFDQTLPLDEAAAGYTAMRDRSAIKTMLLPTGRDTDHHNVSPVIPK